MNNLSIRLKAAFGGTAIILVILGLLSFVTGFVNIADYAGSISVAFDFAMATDIFVGFIVIAGAIIPILISVKFNKVGLGSKLTPAGILAAMAGTLSGALLFGSIFLIIMLKIDFNEYFSTPALTIVLIVLYIITLIGSIVVKYLKNNKFMQLMANGAVALLLFISFIISCTQSSGIALGISILGIFFAIAYGGTGLLVYMEPESYDEASY